jgi:hypothetical protein
MVSAKWKTGQTRTEFNRRLRRHADHPLHHRADRPCAQRGQSQRQRARLSDHQPQERVRTGRGLEPGLQEHRGNLHLGHALGPRVRDHLRQRRHRSRAGPDQEGHHLEPDRRLRLWSAGLASARPACDMPRGAQTGHADGCALSGNILVDIAGHGAEPGHRIERLERRHIQRELSAPLAAPGARERLALEARRNLGSTAGETSQLAGLVALARRSLSSNPCARPFRSREREDAFSRRAALRRPSLIRRSSVCGRRFSGTARHRGRR